MYLFHKSNGMKSSVDWTPPKHCTAKHNCKVSWYTRHLATTSFRFCFTQPDKQETTGHAVISGKECLTSKLTLSSSSRPNRIYEKHFLQMSIIIILFTVFVICSDMTLYAGAVTKPRACCAPFQKYAVIEERGLFIACMLGLQKLIRQLVNLEMLLQTNLGRALPNEVQTFSENKVDLDGDEGYFSTWDRIMGSVMTMILGRPPWWRKQYVHKPKFITLKWKPI